MRFANKQSPIAKENVTTIIRQQFDLLRGLADNHP
jgi:hypothetical protein